MRIFTIVLHSTNTWEFRLKITFLFLDYSVLQLAAQVLDEFDDEEIGVGLLDAKLDKAVAKKLGNRSL